VEVERDPPWRAVVRRRRRARWQRNAPLAPNGRKLRKRSRAGRENGGDVLQSRNCNKVDRPACSRKLSELRGRW